MNPKKKSSESDAKLKKRREQKRRSMQKARDKIKEDEALYEQSKMKERQRWHERRKQGKVKLINDLSERDQRRVRKNWREGYKKCVENKKKAKEMQEFVNANSPQPSENGDELSNPLPSTSRVESGRKKARKNREALRKKLQSAEKRLEILEKKVAKYKKRNQRLKSKLSRTPSPKKRTPRRTVEKMLRNANLDDRVKKRLFMNEIICQQVKEKFYMEKSRKLKRKWVSLLTGSFVEKYKCKKYVEYLTAYQLTRAKVKKHREVVNKSEATKAAVIQFLEQDKCSRICPGKKDTVTKNKIKKQKRFLNDTLKHLHQRFCSETKYKNVSYATFCRYRPFWIKVPSVNNRDTCLCKIHENFAFIVAKLKTHKLIEENSSSDIVKSLCCKVDKKNCLERTCRVCKNNRIKVNDCDSLQEEVTYEKWVLKKVPIMVKNVEKISKRTIKVEIKCSKEELLQVFDNSLPKFLQHTFNIYHQYEMVDNVKKSLKYNEVLLHFDFSENYVCKYGKEIQSVHFGGSKQQISLHTSVLYYSDSLNGELRHQSFVTVSEDTRHDAVAIVAHLEPITTQIKQLVPTLKTVHLLSDGPSTQYRNKTMFQLLGSQLAELFSAEVIAWHFSEASHGKGAPDGIGGTIKRTADSLVAKGVDIDNFEKFVLHLQENSLSVKIIPVSGSRIAYFDQLKPTELQTFKGTNSIHQIVYVKGSKFIQARKLSCATCSFEEKCTHYGLGQIELRQGESTDASKEESHHEMGQTQTQKPKTSSSKKPETTQRKKPIYAAVYSDSDSDPDDPSELNVDSDSDPDDSSKLNVKVNDFVVVKVFGKKTVTLYAGCVTKCFKEGSYQIRFMRRCSDTKNKFVFSNEPEAFVNKDEVVAILKQPNLMNSRGQYVFDQLPQNFKLLG